MSGFISSLKLSESILTRYKFSKTTLISYVDLLLSYDSNKVQRSDLNDLLAIVRVVPSTSYVDETNNIYSLIISTITKIIKEDINDSFIIRSYIEDCLCSDPFLDISNFRTLTDTEIDHVKRNIRFFSSRLYFFEHIDVVEDLIYDIKKTEIYELDKKIEFLCAAMKEISREYENIKSDFDENFMDLEDESFIQNVTDAYATLSDPSSCLKTGMQGFNQLCGGGVKLGRGYVILGISGEGKSGLLLNLAIQIKKNNKGFKTKDPNLKPCVVYITQENSKNETIERIYNITTSNQEFVADNVNKVITDMRTIGHLGLSDDDPVNLAIIYKKPHTNNTSFFTEVIDRMKSRGYEVICIIHDYIQRLNPQNPTYKDSELRLQLGAIINEECTIAKEHNIAFITAAQLNREADSKLLDARSKNCCNLVSFIKRGQIGESLQVIQNADVILIIAREELRSTKQLYLGIHCVKNRDRSEGLEYIYQPFEGRSTIKLAEDINCARPIHRLTMEDESFNQYKQINRVEVKDGNLDDMIRSKNGVITQFHKNNLMQVAQQRLNEKMEAQIIRKEVPQYGTIRHIPGQCCRTIPEPVVYNPLPWTIRLSKPKFSRIVTTNRSVVVRKESELVAPSWGFKIA